MCKPEKLVESRILTYLFGTAPNISKPGINGAPESVNSHQCLLDNLSRKFLKMKVIKGNLFQWMVKLIFYKGKWKYCPMKVRDKF